ILYADIVGFTAISSTYSAQDLVKILNELFARFDRLAEKYQQLRIKILGDCYYCISGAPVERPDHAVLCVHMGLSMVKAIKYVQQKTNSPVDMRVGIHTGAVLAGILGQRQWQFDVYSKDVELANKMESSGKAGRVHLSEKTLGFLNGEFEVEPAYGEKREEALRIAGLKTYFITKVLKPFCPSEHKNGSADPKDVVIEADGPSEIFRDEDDSKAANGANVGDEPSTPGTDDKTDTVEDDTQASEDYKMRLRKELVSRDGHSEISKDTTIFLTFNDKTHETAYNEYREPHSAVPLLAALLVQLVAILYALLVLPRTAVHFEIVIPPLVIIFVMVFISVAESLTGILPAFITLNSKRYNDSTSLRKSTAIIIVLLLGVSNVSDMLAASHRTPLSLNITNVSFASTEMEPASVCLFPSYFTIHCYVNIFHLDEAFRNEDFGIMNVFPLRYTLSALLVAVTIALSFLARHIDKVDRVIFMWKTEVIDQKEKASDMRRRNEALVYNVLPMHVAEHFMGNRKRSHDDLYSQSYAEVGVLFASMPNFSDFYSEETVNNQGLECLRFLNEVISDFDALLELPQFQDIIKIKTIGSTYMAASGLNPSRLVKPDDPVSVRWAHLALLVEFALELKKALQGINEQSFNHFVLKMGVNHGPITAGVIGARKPHYDIWGNTVNVASRMESTGKAGAIQVTEETCQILQTFGYTFEQRGLVAVKGKGQLMTYYLQGKVPRPTGPTASPILQNVTAMETVQEVDESKESPPALAPPPTDGASPAHQLHSISSSTTSPNSVRLNQEYVEMKASNSATTTTMQQESTTSSNSKQASSSLTVVSEKMTTISSTSSTISSTTIETSVSKTAQSSVRSSSLYNGGEATPADESDAQTPLLEGKNIVLAALVLSHRPLEGATKRRCESNAPNIVHRFYPLRHCQRSNRTVIGLMNVKTVRECADFARDKQGLAFNYAPINRNNTNWFDVVREREQNKSNASPWKPQPPRVSYGFEDFYNCHVLDCPEYHNLSTIVNDTRFDYYTLYARLLPTTNTTCIPSIGMFLFEETKLNYSNAYNSCVAAGGSLAHIASDARTFLLSKYIESLRPANNTNATTPNELLYYVGLNETLKDRFFTSANERLDSFTYRAWAPGHPARNRHPPSCVAVTEEGSWKVFNCNRSLPYICELHTSGPALYQPKLRRKCFVKRPNNRIAPSRQVT
uniref:adenylate cyclase n=1 Tax=Anopheles epiroticus TaxID=199890 RepID=A0A182P9H4_9DIPT